MLLNNVGIEVVVNGQSLREISHAGRMFLAAEANGQPYELVLINNTAGRVLAMATIDGLSIMDGKEGTLTGPVNGYVLSPGQRMSVSGWRLDNTTVARFLFGELDAAYAVLMGKPTNIGAIGCAFFHEERPQPAMRSGRSLLDFSPTRGGGHESFGAMRGGGVGTGFGERTQHQVQEVSFRPVQPAFAVLEMVYKTHNDLRAMGVPVDLDVSQLPKAFQQPHQVGCPLPPGYPATPDSRQLQPVG